MLKQGLLAAGFVLAATPAFAQVPVSPGPPMPPPPPGTHEVERTTTTITTVAPIAPPAPEAEVVPAPPSPELSWKPGHWAWNLDGHNYEWVKGSYVERPEHMVAYTAGHWEQGPDGWMWIDGHWR